MISREFWSNVISQTELNTWKFTLNSYPKVTSICGPWNLVGGLNGFAVKDRMSKTF